MSGIQTKAVLHYAIMPGIVPRLKNLFASGFGYIAFLMAQIYAMVRLLPADHPYLDVRNTGRYGIRHVIAESANNLVVSKNNIDQLVIFVLMLTAIVLLAAQLALLGFSLLFGEALAVSMFVTQNPDDDIAFMLLDQVFGAGNFFNSCVASGALCQGETVNPPYPWPFHLALQNMFRFYSLGILLIGVIIFSYFVVVIIVETATTGTPFGQRFQNIWVPIRLVVAIGLLLPLGFGYNSGQYIAFAAAKYGSSFATNAWLLYNNTIDAFMGAGRNNPTGEHESLVAMPKPPDASVFSEAMSLVHACAFSYFLHDERNVISAPGLGTVNNRVGTVNLNLPETPGDIANYLGGANTHGVKPYLVKNPTTWGNAASILPLVNGTTYQQALDFYNKGDIIVRFGREGAEYSEYAGSVEPTCGEIRIPITDKREIDAAGNHTGGDGYLGTVVTQRFFFETLIRDFWYTPGWAEDYVDFAGRYTLLNAAKCREGGGNNPDCSIACKMGCSGGLSPNPRLPSLGCPNGGATNNNPASVAQLSCDKDSITAHWKQNATNDMQTIINAWLFTIWTNYNDNNIESNLDPAVLDRGWGGAGIWFNTIARINGAFITSWMDSPSMTRYPMMMELVQKTKKQFDADITGIEQFDPNINKDQVIPILQEDPAGRAIAINLYRVYEYWNRDQKNMAKSEKVLTSGALETAMNVIFGTHGLFAMTTENAHVHPLAQLVALGKGLVESSVRNVALSTMSAAMGGTARVLDTQAGPLVDAASGFLLSTAFIGLTAGFVLFYIVPFLPFVYFYFAVASWVKTIFEAMVGVPLWALAHLRLDGDGLPGDSAANGYFLIFEIFVRPILSVAGLIAALVIFAAQVRVLHFMWMLVTDNIGGFNSDPLIVAWPGADVGFKRSIVDEFFFTVIYAIIVYMLATSSFKLIDKIPDNILRWAGQGVSSFGDINQDPVESLNRYAAIGGMTAGQQAVGGIQGLARGMGGTAAKIIPGGGP